MTALAYAIQFLNALPALVQMSTQVQELWQDAQAALAQMQSADRDPTPDEWALLNTRIDALRKQLNS